MPTLTAGQSATVSLGVDDIVTIQPNNGETRVESPPGTLVGTYSYVRSFGPASAIVSYKMTVVSGTCYYEVSPLEDQTPAVYSNSTGAALVKPDGSHLTLFDPDQLSASSGAGIVGFLQSGTGAVARTVQDKAREIVSIEDDGAVADSSTDNTTRMQSVIDYAYSIGGDVLVPARAGKFAFDGDLNIPAGVCLIGQGRGRTALTAPTTGSILYYRGTGHGLKLNGTLSGIEKLALIGTASALGAGVLVNGDAVVVESWLLRYLTIYGFTGGTALKLQGINSGAATYGSAFDVRIRNAKTGLHITDTGGGAGFANTNQFYGGAISGGDGLFDYAIRIEGGNDNRIFGMSVEPYTSTYGHIVVERGELTFDGRVEGSHQPVTTPLIHEYADATLDIKGLGGSGYIKKLGNGSMEMTSGKHAEPASSTLNLFTNANLAGADVTARTIPQWTVTETGGASTWTLLPPDIVSDHSVIQVDVPAGGSVEIKPAGGNIPSRPTTTTPVLFGLWVKTDAAQSAYARINGVGGVASSALHSGSATWEAISMKNPTATGSTVDARFVLPGGVAGATFYITAPYFNYGYVPPQVVRPVTPAGGKIYGTFEGNSCTVTLPAAGSNSYYDAGLDELTVPKGGNTVHVTGTARSIIRLNNVAANRMAAGTVLRLVFDIGSVNVTDGNPGYIDLTAAFTSAAPATPSARSWLLLEANADGTWQELSRRA